MIKVKIPAQNPTANLRSYEEMRKSFSWSEATKAFTWSRTGKLNIVHEAIDRWTEKPDTKNRKALVFEKAGDIKTFSYADLRKLSCQWANMLVQHGFKTGERLFIFLDSCPEIYFAMLACARLGVLFCPLFPSLGFDELEERIEDAKPRGILTNPDLAEMLPYEAMKAVKHVFLTYGPKTGQFPGEVPIHGLPEKLSTHFPTRWLSGDTPLYLLYTSGSTGPPKGVVHAHHDMVGQLMTAKYVLDLTEGDILWAACDPAWVTGTVYGAFAPWLCGATSVVQADPFSASTWCRTLERHQVTIWYLTPGSISQLKEAGADLIRRYDFSALRHIAVVGEALAPELIYWFKKNFKLTPHDTWWMTETGMICIANFPSMTIKPGSMGKPVPGVYAAVIDENGAPLPNMTLGELVLKPGWPSMMAGLWHDETRYRAYFRLPGWFLTGDMAIKDEDGYYYHQGRTDDLMKIGVKLIGPYEIERALSRHPAVSEAAVISKTGRPGEPFLKAFITIKKGFTPSTRLNQEIKAFVKASLSSDVALSEIAFLDEIPRTRSGKLLRRVLRAQELGLPIGNPKEIRDV